MGKTGTELLESMADALAHARGAPSGIAVRAVATPDVRDVRRALRISQQSFATAYRIPLSTLKNGEQGRRQPDAPAAADLQVMARRPQEAMDALKPD